jgi:hypothetical protein
VLRAGRSAHSRYASWADYSAGYILGRVLHFDADEFSVFYETALGSHRSLTTDPASPWRTLQWSVEPAAASADGG